MSPLSPGEKWRVRSKRRGAASLNLKDRLQSGRFVRASLPPVEVQVWSGVEAALRLIWRWSSGSAQWRLDLPRSRATGGNRITALGAGDAFSTFPLCQARSLKPLWERVAADFSPLMACNTVVRDFPSGLLPFCIIVKDAAVEGRNKKESFCEMEVLWMLSLGEQL